MPKPFRALCVWTLALGAAGSPAEPRQAAALPELLSVDGARGDDHAPGTREKPLRSLAAAIARLPDPLERSISIELAPGTYATTGGLGMPENSLQLVRRMRPGVAVTLRAAKPEGKPVVLAWNVAPGSARLHLALFRARRADGAFLDTPILGPAFGTSAALLTLHALEEPLPAVPVK